MVQRDALGMPVFATLHTRTSVNGRLPNLLFLPGPRLWPTPTLNFITPSRSLIAKRTTATGRWKRRGTEGTEPERGEEKGTATAAGRGKGTFRGSRVRRSMGLLRIEGTAQLLVPLQAHPLAGRLSTALRRAVAPLSEGGLLPSQHLQTSLKGYEKTARATPITSLPHAGTTFLPHHVVHALVLGTRAETGNEAKGHEPGVMSRTVATQKTSQPLSTARLYPQNLQSQRRCSPLPRHLQSPRYLKCLPLFLISRQLARQNQHPEG